MPTANTTPRCCEVNDTQENKVADENAKGVIFTNAASREYRFDDGRRIDVDAHGNLLVMDENSLTIAIIRVGFWTDARLGDTPTNL
jgi:hypothetical protein